MGTTMSKKSATAAPEATHTAGPWDMRPGDHGHNTMVVFDADMAEVAIVWSAVNDTNARLIKAAPTMLAALKRAVAGAEGRRKSFSGRTSACQGDLDACLAAIALATVEDTP